MNESVFLTREAILETQDTLQIEKVELTRGFVYVREMTAFEKNIWEQSLLKKAPSGNPNVNAGYETSLDNFRAKLAVNTMCDETGKLLFDMRDVKKISIQMSASNLEKVVDKAQGLNSITEEDKDEILKNSEAEPAEDSNLNSASN